MRLPYFLERVEWVYLNVLYSLDVLLHPEASAKAVRGHTARIQGAFPHQNGNGVIFFACDDEFMVQFGFTLILSCYENARPYGVHVHLYEPSSDILQRLEFLKETLGDLNLSYTYERDIDFGSLPERGMYYTAFRFLAVGKVLEESKSLIVCLDADSLIMSSPQQVIAEMQRHDVGLYFRLKKRRVNKKIAAFCVLFNNTRRSLDFLGFVAGLSVKFKQKYPKVRSRFYFDQSGLYFSYLFSGLKGKRSFYAVGKTVVDYEFSDTACIWTAKGNRKNDAVFLNASRRIRQKYAAALGAS